MTQILFTGERLHEDDQLFGVDLVRHQAAYAHAIETATREDSGRILDLGGFAAFRYSDIRACTSSSIRF